MGRGFHTVSGGRCAVESSGQCDTGAGQCGTGAGERLEGPAGEERQLGGSCKEQLYALSSLSMGSPGACGSDWVVGGVFNSLLVFVCDLASFALCCLCVSYSKGKNRSLRLAVASFRRL